jgi:hypothetical protein
MGLSSSRQTCGTHFGETKEPASIVVTPVAASFSINWIFVSNGTIFFSFCSPSRGPTSTILMRLSNAGA